jgi:hypothetical protein
MMVNVLTRVLAVGLCIAALAGCQSRSAGEEPTVSPTSSVEDPNGALRERPSFEDAQRQYLAAVTVTANRVAALAPGMTWDLRENSWRGCGGAFVDTDGVQAYVYAVFNLPLPEPLWPQALQIVKDEAAKLGAANVQTVVDQPGNHDVMLTSGSGVEIEFGTAKATILSAKSDCRLRQAAPQS